MKNVLEGIWQNAPIWVWPLFFVLLALGIFSMRTRRSSIIPYFFFPLLGLTSVGSITNLVHVPLNWTVFGIAYILGAFIAFRWQDGLVLQKTGRHMQLKGERMTLVILMAIFFSNFVTGVFRAVAPEVLLTFGYTVIFAFIIGACCGSFTGRAVRVITLKDR